MEANNGVSLKPEYDTHARECGSFSGWELALANSNLGFVQLGQEGLCTRAVVTRCEIHGAGGRPPPPTGTRPPDSIKDLPVFMTHLFVTKLGTESSVASHAWARDNYAYNFNVT